MYQDPEELIPTSRGLYNTSTTPNWYIPPPPPPPASKSRILWLVLVVCLVTFVGGGVMTYALIKEKNLIQHSFGSQHPMTSVSSSNQPTTLPTSFIPSPTPSPQNACIATAMQNVAIFPMASFQERKLWSLVPTSTVNIFDQANVLDQNCILTQASILSYPLNIYTTDTFKGTSSDFYQQALSQLTSANLMIIKIDTVHRRITIMGGSNIPLSDSQYNDAIQAFKNTFKSGGYTGATVAAIRSLEQSLSDV